ncbi:MAG: extracellular solute-binding protein [Clostridium sp.]|nr:extracellular solute-binding protein [Clostridium sp.]
MKKLHRAAAAAMATVLSLSLLAACGSGDATEEASSSSAESVSSAETPSQAEVAPPDTGALDEATLAELGLEFVDDKYRFTETRDITVEIFDRGLDGGKTAPEDNVWTDWIKEGMLRDHNVNVTYVPVPRWTEADDVNNLLASGSAPDVCVTYNYAAIQQYANMGGVTDLAEYVDKYAALIPALWDLLGTTNMYYDKDPVTGQLWALEAFLSDNGRINTFVRKDWLEKLGLELPTTLEEFEAVLIAFRDNAETLLGADASQIIPFGLSFDVGWRAYNLLGSSIPDDITDKELYIYGFDDRHFSKPWVKESVKILNRWYNEGLIWKDFPLYGEGDTTEDNLIKSGYVGSLEHQHNQPYRDGENGWSYNLHNVVGEEADYIAVEPFLNDAGVPKKYIAGTVDRKVFFPATNDEPIASLLYLNWITDLENRLYLQVGEEGRNHEVAADGAIQMLTATDEYIQNSLNNIDYTITINGVQFDGDPDKTYATRALSFPGVDPALIARTYEVNFNYGFVAPTFHFSEIKSEEGMNTPLKEKRDALFAQAITCTPDQFDTVWDSGYQDYLNSGMQAIIDERTQAWEARYGDAVDLPEE